MTKEEDFKQRFVAVLKDLQENGSRDNEAMWLLGSLASDLADDLKAADWSALKRGMQAQTYDTLLRTFEAQGNEHHREGRDKHAYAIQVLAVSLIARTQGADPQMAAGEALLDQIVDFTVAVYRREKTARAN
nr:hypothetical protein [uncultured Devosia sp.]